MSLQRALILLLGLVLAAGVIPAGFVAHGRLSSALEEEVRESLAMAPDLLRSRWASTVDVRMMHARDMARTPGLAEALMGEDRSRAARIVEQVGAGFPEAPVLVGPDGQAIIPGEPLPEELLTATRRGEMPVEAVSGEGRVVVVSLAPILMEDRWVGATGGISDLEEGEAATLAGLTRSEVLILDADGGLVGSSLPSEEGEALARGVTEAGVGAASPGVSAEGAGDLGAIRELTLGGVPYLALVVPLAQARIVFLKNLQREMAVLPLLQRIALWSGGITLALALILGSLFAARIARPVGSLADAAEKLTAGDFEAPLRASGVSEVNRLSEAFQQMRESLRARLAELEEANRAMEEANRELADRQERLVVLQGELVQRDRLASAGRLLAQLAHEIRNPIASIRNCLEVLRRRAQGDPDAREMAEMAIDELLRMHELTEQMMDIHRPRDPEGSACEVTRVAREVASLLRAGTEPGKELTVSVVSPGEMVARVSEDSLKQVLLNLGLNAREAMEDGGPMELIVGPGENGKDTVKIEVLDRGPGIPEGILSRIFDPFFTTKSQVHGVGLGLFTAEALVRTYGGRVEAANRSDGPGARFTVEFPVAGRDTPDGARPHDSGADAGTEPWRA